MKSKNNMKNTFKFKKSKANLKYMYRVIRNRFSLGKIKLVTAINTLGTFISLSIILWIFCFVSGYDMETNIQQRLSEEVIRGFCSHGFLSSLLNTVYLTLKQDEIIRPYYICLSIGSLWLLFTTGSIWPSIMLSILFVPTKLNYSL